MNGKDLLSSRSFWAMTVTFIISVLAVFGIDFDISAEAQATIVSFIMLIVGTFWRVKTDEPITSIGGKEINNG